MQMLDVAFLLNFFFFMEIPAQEYIIKKKMERQYFNCINKLIFLFATSTV